MFGNIDWWIHKKDKNDPDNYRKAKFFVWSFFLFLLGCALAEIYLFVAEFPLDVVVGNAIFTVVLLLGLILYRNFGGRIVLVNVVSAFGFMSNIGTYDFSGGIYSGDLFSGIIICAWIYLVSNRLVGTIWFVVTLLNIIFFYYAELHGFKDFRSDLNKMSAGYSFANLVFLTIFLFFVIYLYDNSKESFLKLLRKSMEEVGQKNAQLELFKQDMQASITYAKRIQLAVLPQEESIYRAIPLSFILYKPKDIVSGDFFWFHKIDEEQYVLVLADCTGHGVPGAFMTVIGSSLLNQIVIENKVTAPAEVIHQLDDRLVHMLKQEKQRFSNVQDGMDLSVIHVDSRNKVLKFSSAKRPLLFIRDGKMEEYKGSKHSVGGIRSGEKKFEEIRIGLMEDDQCFLYSDGFTDQFGGDKGKKYSSKRFKEKVLSLHLMPVQMQHKELEKEFEIWKGTHEQLDDVCVIGIRF